MQTSRETLTDWAGASHLPIPDDSHPDDAMEPVAWATVELPMPRTKEHTNLEHYVINLSRI